jgi:hypothetical protein
MSGVPFTSGLTDLFVVVVKTGDDKSLFNETSNCSVVRTVAAVKGQFSMSQLK